jgi:hypothetical protein
MADLALLLRGEQWNLVTRLLHELGHELFAELPVVGVGFELQGIEAGRHAAFERLIRPAHGPDADLRTAIFVEDHAAEALVLGGEGQERQFERGLAHAGAATDKGVARILLVARIPILRGHVEIEIVGLAARGLEQGQGFAPGIARSFATGEVVKRTEADKVPAGDDGFAWPQTPVARDLCEPGTFGDHIDPRHLEPRPVLKDGPGVGERGAHRFHCVPKMARL